MMEIPLSFTTLLLIFSCMIFFLAKGLKTTKSLDDKKKKLPPSVPGRLPLIGNMHQLASSTPNRAIRELNRKYGPVIHLQLGEISAIAISSREAANEVMKVRDPACAGRSASMGSEIMWYNYTDIAFSPYNEYWRQMRKVCVMELLSSKMVRSFGSLRLDEVSRLVKSIMSSSGKVINLTPFLYSYNSALICRVSFGRVARDKDTLIRLMKDGLAYAGGYELADFFPSSKFLQAISWRRKELWRMRSKLDVTIDSIIDEHKKNLSETGGGNGEFGGEDIVDVFIRLQKSGELPIPITYDNIKAVIFDIFSGATESSSTTADWAMAEMMRNPHVMAKAQEEVRGVIGDKGQLDDEADLQKMKYLKLVIKETLRLHTSTPVIPRECQEECEVDGYTIPRKTKLMINVWALGRDPKYWDEAETFKPERFENKPLDFLGNNFEFIPFGAGRRACPGISYGLANIELVLANLLYHFNWSLPHGTNPNDVDMTEKRGLTLPRKNGLYVIATPYKP